jgi:flagella basal body P-ring formation protein FlgA
MQEQVAGLAVRRAMRSGEIVRSADLTKPELVQRNEPVMLIFEVPGIVLTVRGKALESGAQGELVSVLNTQSKRTVQGVVSGPGRVTVSGNAQTHGATARIAANVIDPRKPETGASPRHRTE